MIWLLLSLILIPVLLLLFLGGREDESEANPVAHYRRQLAELERDEESGILGKEAATAARLEIERRILKLADHRAGLHKGVRSSRMVVPALCLVLIVASFGVYKIVGTPGAKAQPGQVINLLAIAVDEKGLSLGEAIKQIEGHLAENPDDKQGWQVLARSARSAKVFSKAASAFGALVRLDPSNISWRVQQLEVYIAMANGKFTPAAELLLQALLEAEPKHPAGQYYLGMARLQEGNIQAAKAIWLGLADRSPKGAPWMASVWERLGELGENPPALSQDQLDQVANLSDDERDAFIQSMIAQLEARLESAPNDPEGWLMLARSRAALGQKEMAIATLVKALGLIDPARHAEVQAFLDNLRETPNS